LQVKTYFGGNENHTFLVSGGNGHLDFGGKGLSPYREIGNDTEQNGL